MNYDDLHQCIFAAIISGKHPQYDRASAIAAVMAQEQQA